MNTLAAHQQVSPPALIDTASLAIVLRRYGCYALDEDSPSSRFAAAVVAEPGSPIPDAAIVLLIVTRDTAPLPGLTCRAEPPGNFLYESRHWRVLPRRRAYRALLAHVSFSGSGLTPIWTTRDGRTVVGWLQRGAQRCLVVGLDLVEELVRYTQGDPAKVHTARDKTLWGSGHERPAYLFEDHIVRGSEMTPWADWLGFLVARAISTAMGLPLIASLPRGAAGGVLLTGDDDQAELQKYATQQRLLNGFPITYLMLPHTKHSPATLAELPGSVEYGVHVDALDEPDRYASICLEQTASVRELTGRALHTVRNHGHLNQGYWTQLAAWERSGLTLDFHIRGLDGTCPTGSYLPFRVRRPDGSWSHHWSVFSTFSDSMFFLQKWSEAKQIRTINALAAAIGSRFPGVIVLNFHPQNVDSIPDVHRAVMAIGRRNGWAALGGDSYAQWLIALDRIRMSGTGESLCLASPTEISDVALHWPGEQSPLVLAPWRGEVEIVTPAGRAPQGRREVRQVDRIRSAKADQRASLLPREFVDRDGWHSWDPTPWAHPWLSADNLAAARQFDQAFFERLIERHGTEPAPGTRIGFVGNLANNMALRALPLRRQGVPITLYLHPADRYVMSHPSWELSDAMLETEETDIDRLLEAGVSLPDVPDVVRLPEPEGSWTELLRVAEETPAAGWPPQAAPSFVDQLDLLVWPQYFAYLPALEALQSCSVLFAAQAPYLAYLSHRPYLAGQTGGDLWLEASRHDMLGNLQRRSYACASAILATNPWAYSNARRFGFRHVLYVPLIIDTEQYAPGRTDVRTAWEQQVGGDFFVLVTARLDRKWKGSDIAIEGFARFAAQHPGARLVLIGWGSHSQELIGELDRRGLAGRYVRMPMSGKRKLVEYLRAADAVLDQFIIGYYGATALEAMSTGVPVIMHLARTQYDALCPTGAPPVLDASDATGVAEQLLRLAASRETLERAGHHSRQWVERNHGVGIWRDRYVAALNAAAAGEHFEFARSPLSAPLSDDEVQYHEAGLRAAPVFPSYDI